jgi:eukaryotic-like serine/threonine-protein kinase
MPTQKEASDALLGAVLENRFHLESIIGRGGISTVYKARHQAVDLLVAAKVLHSSFSNTQESIERLRREAAIINTLNHPNIVHMYSFGVLSGELKKSNGDTELVEEPRPYLVLEHLNGIGLDAMLKREGRLPIKAIYEIMGGVFEGLKSAHDQGVIHRDIKPSNVMLVKEVADYDKEYPGEYNRHVKLLDFGIAKCNKCNDQEAQALTQPGYIFGSPLYMSPEQCMGRDLDLRSDIYSLGCMLYEMLAGHPPFDGENAMHTFAMHIYEAPKSLKTQEGLHDLSQGLDEVVLKCLRKDVEERFSSIDEFRLAFEETCQLN